MTALLLTADSGLHHEVVRLAAAAGVEPRHVADATHALVPWTSADLVLVGADCAGRMAALAPQRRARVWVVATGDLGPEVFRAAVDLGAEAVLSLPEADEWLAELLADACETDARGRLVGVIGGCGGAGATTLACAMGQAAARRGPTLLVDGDRRGPGLDRMLGLEDEAGVRWHDLEQSQGRLGARALRDAVPRVGALGVLTWGATTGLEPGDQVVRQTVAAARRGHDLVVVDLPRHGDRAVAELGARCDRVLVVCPATLRGVAATVRVLADLGLPSDRLGLVLRPGALPAEDVAAATGLDGWIELKRQRGVEEAVDLGMGPLRSSRGPLARAVRAALEEAA